MKDSPQIICTSCHLPFTPIVTSSGFHFSRLCSGCLTAKNRAKRIEVLSQRVSVSIRPKAGKKGREVDSSKPKPKRKGRGVNISELDRVFSIFIRQRDADKDGTVRCISCGDAVHWKKSDCGHYINRKHMATRYDEMNCNGQCRSCNRFDEGNMEGYRRGLIDKYGPKAPDELYIRKFNTVHIGQDEINILTDYYKTKIKPL